MSATIDAERLKFSIFGRGYDDTRKDSGEGEIIQVVEPPITADTALIDETGQYVWFVNSGNFSSVSKWDISDIEDWQNEGQTILTGTGGHLEHPSNVPNNYGIYFPYPDAGTITITVFDMTDDTVYHTITDTDTSYIYLLGQGDSWDSILVDDKIYLARIGTINFPFVCIDLTNGTLTYTAFNGELFYGFINDELMYTSNRAVWFSDTLAQYGEKFDGTKLWTVYGVEPHTAYHEYVKVMAICANNFMYFSTFRGGHWRIAKYKGKSAPVFDPVPMYSSDFGKFGDELTDPADLSNVAFDDERKRCAFTCGYNLCITDDLKDVIQLEQAESANDAYYSLALRDDILISRDVGKNIIAYIL